MNSCDGAHHYRRWWRRSFRLGLRWWHLQLAIAGKRESEVVGPGEHIVSIACWYVSAGVGYTHIPDLHFVSPSEPVVLFSNLSALTVQQEEDEGEGGDEKSQYDAVHSAS